MYQRSAPWVISTLDLIGRDNYGLYKNLKEKEKSEENQEIRRPSD